MMPSFDTPTIDDARGIDPICTRANGTCAFHELTLAEALANDRKTLLIVSTPGFCQTAVCGPILEMAIEEAPNRPGLDVVHAEVYRNPSEGLEELADVMEALGLLFEPSMFFIEPDGMIADRIDFTVDRRELGALLDGFV